MTTMSITLQSSTGTKTFDYILRNNSASKKFCQVWRNIVDNHTGEPIQFLMECPVPMDNVIKLNQAIHDICADIVAMYPNIEIPSCWTQTPYSQYSLNELHDKFAENAALSSDPKLRKFLSDLNFSIHQLEAKMLNDTVGNLPPYMGSYSAVNLEKQYALPLEPEDSFAYDGACFEQSVLIIGYNTLGKDLQALAFDNDTTSMLNNQRYVPKTTVMSQFSMIVPHKIIGQQQLIDKRKDIQKFVNTWCEQNNTRFYGVDPEHFINRIGRMIIADKVNAHEDDWKWIMAQDNLHLSEFTLENIGTLSKQQDNIYLKRTYYVKN